MDELIRQAEVKALSLLTDMDRTEAQLRAKLRQKGYPQEVIDEAIAYVYSFGYVNDVQYARRFVENKKKSKSRYELMGALMQKGLERDMVCRILDECYPSCEESETLRYLIEKQQFSVENRTQEEKRKLSARLLRKGFHYEDIQKIIQVSSWNA